MRERWEMYTALRMQNMQQIRKKNVCFVINKNCRFCFVVNFTFRALGVESPRGGAMSSLPLDGCIRESASSAMARSMANGNQG